MFMITEIHPLEDGNGRIARLMMNTELVAENVSKVIIPTVYRTRYLGSLRARSLRMNSIPFHENVISRIYFFCNVGRFLIYRKSVVNPSCSH